MNLDDLALSEQTGPPAPLPQGALKKYAKLLFTVLMGSVFMFTLLFCLNKKGVVSKYYLHDYFQEAIYALVISLNIIGGEELKSSGNKKYANILFKSSFIWVGVSLLYMLIVFKNINQNSFLPVMLYGFALLISMPFPLALYLNFRKKKSSTESTVADAN